MVQRYNPDYVMHAARFEPFARENEHGEFVKFSDYEALKAERDAQQKRADALAVSCSLYREAISKSRRLINVDEMGDADDVLAQAERELSSHDAALAAIRLEAKIEGVNELAERIAEMHSKTAPGSNIEKKLMFAAEAAIAYANGLREAK